METKNKKHFWKLFLSPIGVLMIILILAGYHLCLNKLRQPLQGSVALIGDPTSDDLSSSCFDLDKGIMTSADEADICFGASVGSTIFYTLSPVNNASAKIMGFTQPNFEDCKRSLDQFTKGNIPELETNSYICILTNQQQIALLCIKTSRRTASTRVELTIEFTTWKNSIHK